MEISNKTKSPLRIPLPGGKKLHLGAGRIGQISSKAAAHPPLKKLIDEGQIEVIDGGRSQGTSGASGRPQGSSYQGGGSRGIVRHTGDR